MDPGFSPSPHPPPWLEPPPPYEVAIKTTCSSTRLRRAYSDTHLATEPLFGQSREISFEVWCRTMGMPRHSVHHTQWYSTRVGFLLRLWDDCLLTATHFIILEACVCYSRHQVKEIVQNSGLLLSFLAERFRRRIVCQVWQKVSVRSPKTFIISKKDAASTEWPHGHSIDAASFFHWCASHTHTHTDRSIANDPPCCLLLFLLYLWICMFLWMICFSCIPLSLINQWIRMQFENH